MALFVGSRASHPDARRQESPQASLPMLVHCTPPLFAEIVSYLATPVELTRMCGTAAKWLSEECGFEKHPEWERMYGRKWRAFHDCLSHAGAESSTWRHLFRETCAGRQECLLEVFHRGLKLGFAMSALSARVRWDPHAGKDGAYVAKYLSASECPPEVIPGTQGHRLRFCPEPVRRRLLDPGLGPLDSMLGVGRSPGPPHQVPLDGAALAAMPMDVTSPDGPVPDIEYAKAPDTKFYPYAIMNGTDGLVPGQGVELQWKMQLGSPFGWWYGMLEALKVDVVTGVAKAVVTFPHFPPHSRWYRLVVEFGDDQLRQCDMGGYSGGLRPVSPTEKDHWMHFLPSEPIEF